MSDQQPTSFIEIYRSTDPVEAEMVNESLCEAGIDARLLGTRLASLMGAAPGIFEQRIEVPASQREEASAILGAIVREEAQDVDAATGEDGDELAGPEASPLSWLVAAGAALVFPGLAHIYARRAGTAISLMLAVGLGVGSVATGSFPRGIWMIAGALLFDLVGGQVAVRSFNGGNRASFAVQVTHGLIALGLISLTSVAMTASPQ